MWTVVHFEYDNTVAAVPEFWYRHGKCAWPKKYNSKLVIKRANPNTLDFSNFKAKILFKNIDNYLKARSLAQENSDISSNDVLYTDSPRDIIKKKSIPICKNIQITSPPTFTDSDESNKNDDDFDKTYSPVKSQLNISNASQLMRNDDNPFDNCNEVTQHTPGSSRKKLKFGHQVKTPTMSSTLLLNPNDQLLPTPHHTIRLNQVNENQTPTNDELENKFNVLISGLKGIERNITVIKHEIKNFHDRLHSVVKMQETIHDQMINLQPLVSTNYGDAFENGGIIYIDDDAKLNIMEDKLLNETLFRSKVVKELSRLCSTNIAETVRKIMQKMFSDEMLSGYSYIGFKGKKLFSTLQSCTIIFEFIRMMKNFKDSLDIDIERPIKNWMGQATPRLKKIAQKNAAIADMSTSGV